MLEGLGLLPPQIGRDLEVRLPFLWAFLLGAYLLVPPGGLWDHQTGKQATPRVPAMQCPERAYVHEHVCMYMCVCVCVCVYETTFPSVERDLRCWWCLGWGVGG